jgi:hypothetical protein
MCPPLVGSDYYEGSATPEHHQLTASLPTQVGGVGRFPRSPLADRRGRCPAESRQPRHRYAAALPGGLLLGPVLRGRSRPPAPPAGVRCKPGPYPPDWSRSSTYGTSTLVPRVHLLVSLAGPGPSGSADPSRRCRGCSHPPWRLPGKAAPGFTGLLRQAGGGVLAPPLGQTEPRGAPQDLTIPRRSRRRSQIGSAVSTCPGRCGGGATAKHSPGRRGPQPERHIASARRWACSNGYGASPWNPDRG